MRHPAPQPPDPFWKFREGSAFAWIAVCLAVLAVIFGFGYVFPRWVNKSASAAPPLKREMGNPASKARVTEAINRRIGANPAWS
jgi:hypothetical protein